MKSGLVEGVDSISQIADIDHRMSEVSAQNIYEHEEINDGVPTCFEPR